MTSTARPTTSARWWRSSCAERSGSPPRERGAPSPASDSRTPWWPEGGGVKIRVIVNGSARELEIDAHALLLDVLRDGLDLKGAKRSCDMQVCGACTVLVDGLAVSACTYLAVEAEGRDVQTVEGLAEDGRLGSIQQAFVDHGAVQCGFCTSGMLLTTKALIGEQPAASGADLTWCDPFFGPAFRDRPILAVDVARYEGDPVAAVVAIDEATAAEALELIEVDYAALPAVITLDEALAPGAPRVHAGQPLAGHFADLSTLKPEPGTNVCHHFRYARGHTDAALADAPLVVDEAS